MPLHNFAKQIKTHEVSGDEVTNDEYKPHEGSFSTYFRNKQIKLDTQAKVTYSQKSEIFRDCYIYINGYTNPSAQKLKSLIVENGGQVCAFLAGKTYATHVVATSLTSRKFELFKNMKVIKPAWVTESVKMCRQLPWSSYRTIVFADNHLFFNGNTPSSSGSKFHAKTYSGEDGSDTDAKEALFNDKNEGIEEIPSNAVQNDGTENNQIQSELEIYSDFEEDHPATPLLDSEGPQGDAARTQWIVDQRSRVNTMDRSFIRDYFAKSRLHYLSTRKLELRAKCRKYISPLSVKKVAERVLMHVDFDSFFVSVALKSKPHLIDRPVCVSYGSKGSDIASCNYAARQQGVSNGQWVARAKTMCPDLICLPYEFEEYTRCSDILYETLLNLFPYKITAISVDEAMVDITNLAAKRPVAEICDFVQSKIRSQTGIEVSIGVGKNILLAKMALRQAKPAGKCIGLKSIDFRESSVRALPGVGRHICTQLDNLDVKTVGDLLKISLDKLQQTVGNHMGQKLYGYAMGADSDDISILDVPVRSVGVDIGWGVRVINEMEKLEFVDRCTRELWDRLARSNQVNEVLTVKVYVKSPGAAFLVPKYMGHGLCDIKSKSLRIGKVQLSEFLSATQNIVRRLECAPLEFRGFGLHMKVSDPSDDFDPRQSHIAFNVGPEARLERPANISSSSNVSPSSKSHFDIEASRPAPRPKITPVKPPMVSVQSRKKRRIGLTLTQMITPAPTQPLEEVDLSVLAELPSQIRKEILLNEDEYLIPQDFKNPSAGLELSLYRTSQFMGMSNPQELRHAVKQWVESNKAPLANDARAFYDFICESARDNSNWIATVDLCEWLGTQINTIRSSDVPYETSSDGNGKWHELWKLVDSKLQKILADRI